jgi:RimJ/RimL family protein N-acetyltransferase
MKQTEGGHPAEDGRTSPTRPVISVPDLETERLILRGHAVDDHPACVALWSDPDVVRFIGGVPSTAEEVWARMLRYAGLWALLGYGYWVIETRNGDFVGEVGFADFRRALSPAIGDAPELGYALLPAFHGKGYATEAAGASLTWLRGAVKPPRTICLINPQHHASLRVANKLGYGNPVKVTYRGHEQLLLERIEPAAAA